MGLDPMGLLQMKNRFSIFAKEHPKAVAFFSSIKEIGSKEGTIYEIKVTPPDGQPAVCNIKLTANDIETIRMLMK